MTRTAQDLVLRSLNIWQHILYADNLMEVNCCGAVEGAVPGDSDVVKFRIP
jgi:hypothetical protein